MLKNLQSSSYQSFAGFYPDSAKVKWGFGPEQTEAAVEADKQREQVEKSRKRSRYPHDRNGQ